MTRIPVICDQCGLVFPSRMIDIQGGLKLTLAGNTEMCPRCRSMAPIPDGVFEFLGDTVRIISVWPIAKQQKFLAALAAVQKSPDPAAAAESLLQSDPELSNLAMSTQAKGMIAIALVSLLLQCGSFIHDLTGDDGTGTTTSVQNVQDIDVTINVQNVLEQIYAQPPDPPAARPPQGKPRR